MTLHYCSLVWSWWHSSPRYGIPVAKTVVSVISLLSTTSHGMVAHYVLSHVRLSVSVCNRFLLHPGGSVDCCEQPICLCVSVSVCVWVCLSVCEHIFWTAGTIFMKFGVQIPCVCGSFLLWQRCDTLCTSGFMDHVTFGRNAHATSSVVIPGQSLISVNALFCKQCISESNIWIFAKFIADSV